MRTVKQWAYYHIKNTAQNQRETNNYKEDKISNLIASFQKPNETQHSLSVKLEKWKQATDKREYVFVIIKDLSKAFDTIKISQQYWKATFF